MMEALPQITRAFSDMTRRLVRMLKRKKREPEGITPRTCQVCWRNCQPGTYFRITIKAPSEFPEANVDHIVCGVPCLEHIFGGLKLFLDGAVSKRRIRIKARMDAEKEVTE